MVVHRRDMRATLARLCRLMTKAPALALAAEDAGAAEAAAAAE